jgi:hypothetical protein
MRYFFVEITVFCSQHSIIKVSSNNYPDKRNFLEKFKGIVSVDVIIHEVSESEFYDRLSDD